MTANETEFREKLLAGKGARRTDVLTRTNFRLVKSSFGDGWAYRVQTGRNWTVYDGHFVGGRLWEKDEFVNRAANHAFGKGYAQMSPASLRHAKTAFVATTVKRIMRPPATNRRGQAPLRSLSMLSQG